MTETDFCRLDRAPSIWATKQLGRWLSVSCLAVLALSGAAEGETLDEALVQSYLNNPDLRAGRATVRGNDEVINQELSGYLPDLAVVPQISRTEGQNAVADLDQTEGRVSLVLEQNIYEGGRTDARVAEAKALARASRAELVQLEQSIFSSVIDAYTRVWQDEAVLELAINNEERLLRQLEATRSRNEAGVATGTDVAQAIARHASARADIENARSNLAASRAAYERVVGQEANELEDPAVLEKIPTSLAEAQAIAVDNPQISSFEYQVAAQRYSIEDARAGWLPNLDLTGSLNYGSRSNGENDWDRSGVVGLELRVPIYQGGLVRAQVRQEQDRLDNRRNSLESTRRLVREAVSSSWDNLLATGAARLAFEEEIRANNIALDGVRAEADEGLRTVLDVLDAQQELFISEVRYVRASREEVVASYDLKSAIGMLTVDGLRLDVEPYDPEAYYQPNRIRLFGLDIP